MIHQWLTRLFNAPEEINGMNRCPTYLYRWTLLKGADWAVYLHHFVGDDWSRDLHDHPKRFISVGLWGWYIEEKPSRDLLDRHRTERKKWHAPWIRSFPATHIHRLTVPSKNCWTLVIVLHRVRDWGFWHLGRFIPWKSYVKGEDAAIADKMKACE